METFEAAVPGGALVGTVSGSGTPVLLLHGGPGLGVGYLEDLVAARGAPAVLRSDNGPEFISEAMADWAGTRTGLSYIPPGSPWRNGYVESFNSRIRDECLNINSFYSLLHAQVIIGDWKDEYNHHRRHSSLGYLPPAEYARKCTHQMETDDSQSVRTE